MLTQLLTLGIFASASSGGGGGTETGQISATPARTVKVDVNQSGGVSAIGIPYGAPIWGQPFDPADRAPFAIDFSALLPGDEEIAAIDEIAISAAGSMLGLSVDLTTGYGPIIDEAVGKKIQFWPVVNMTYWNSLSFSAGGVMLPISFRILTNSTLPRRISSAEQLLGGLIRPRA